MSDKLTLFDRIQKSLFSTEESDLSKLTPAELEIRTRYMGAFAVWLENPTYTDQQIVNFIIRTYGINKSQAYIDLNRLRVMLGNIRNAGKEWHRHTVAQMALKAYAIAEKANDAKAMAAAAGVLGKYTRCDQLEAEDLPWDSIVPPNFEPSPDVTILNFKRDPNAEKKREKLRRKYMQETEDAQLADVIDDGTGRD
jgi:hypothetical protein